MLHMYNSTLVFESVDMVKRDLSIRIIFDTELLSSWFLFYRIELVVDNRVNRSTLSANGIRNAVSLQPVLYVGGIPNSNNINLTGSGLNSYGFQGCLSSFIVDGRLLDYQTALVLHGSVKMNVCSGNFLLNKNQRRKIAVASSDITSNENDGKLLCVVHQSVLSLWLILIFSNCN
jgi:hypothetical protein